MAQLYIDALRSRGDDGSCDATCEKLYSRMERRACEYASMGICYSCDPAVCTKYGISCSNSMTMTPTVAPPEDDTSWIVVIGTIAVIGGLLAAGATGAVIIKARQKKTGLKKGEKSEKKKDKSEKKAERYVLQLSKDKLQVSTEKSDSFSVTVWKLLETGEYIQQPGASIQIFSPSIPELLVEPSFGMGNLLVTVSLSKPVTVTSADLTISATAGGKTQNATVHVTIEQSVRVGFE